MGEKENYFQSKSLNSTKISTSTVNDVSTTNHEDSISDDDDDDNQWLSKSVLIASKTEDNTNSQLTDVNAEKSTEQPIDDNNSTQNNVVQSNSSSLAPLVLPSLDS